MQYILNYSAKIHFLIDFVLKLRGELKIFLDYAQRDVALARFIEKAGNILVGMAHDFLCLFGMVDVVADTLLEVAEVSLYGYVVIVGDKLPLHKPSLKLGLGHHRYRVGRHHPLEVAGDVIALEGEDKLEAELLADGHLVGAPLGCMTAGIAEVANGIAEVHLEEARALRLVVDFAAEDCHIRLLLPSNSIMHEGEMTHSIEVEEHRASILPDDGTTLDKCRLLGDVCDVAPMTCDKRPRGEPSQPATRVKEVDRSLASAAEATYGSGIVIPAREVKWLGEFAIVVDAVDNLGVVGILVMSEHPVTQSTKKTRRDEHLGVVFHKVE